MIQQLRIYENLLQGNKAAFHARLSRSCGAYHANEIRISIVAMWETMFGEKTEFALSPGWPDEATKTAAWSAFMADTEWSDIKRVNACGACLMWARSRIVCSFRSTIHREGAKPVAGRAY